MYFRTNHVISSLTFPFLDGVLREARTIGSLLTL